MEHLEKLHSSGINLVKVKSIPDQTLSFDGNIDDFITAAIVIEPKAVIFSQNTTKEVIVNLLKQNNKTLLKSDAHILHGISSMRAYQTDQLNQAVAKKINAGLDLIIDHGNLSMVAAYQLAMIVDGVLIATDTHRESWIGFLEKNLDTFIDYIND